MFPIYFLKRVMLISLLVLLTTSQAGAVSTATGVWTSIGPGAGDILALAIDPQTPTILYIGKSRDGVFKSTNGGGNWEVINNGLPYTQYGNYPPSYTTANIIAIDPLTPATLYIGTDVGVYKSINGGGYWQAVNNGLPTPPYIQAHVQAFAIDPKTPSTLYAGTFGGGVFKSTNSGASWSPVNTGLTDTWINALAINPLMPSTLYAGTQNSVFKSTNSGGSWQVVNDGLPVDTIVRALAIDPLTPATLYVVTDGDPYINQKGYSVYKSTNGGVSWSAANTGLTDLDVHTLVIDPLTPTTLYAGTHNGDYYNSVGHLFKSINGGGSWEAANTGLPNYILSINILAIDPLTPSSLYAGTRGGGVFKSTNGGISWQFINAGLQPDSWAVVLAIDPLTPTTFYMMTHQQVFKTTDAGENWQRANTGLPGDPTYYLWHGSLVIDPKTPTTLFAGTFYWDVVYKSTNGGGNWQATANIGLTGLNVTALAIDPVTTTTLFAGTGECCHASSSGQGIFKSTNGGNNWEVINNGLPYTEYVGYPSVQALSIDPQKPSILYAGTMSGVFKSTNGGANWTEANNGLASTYIYALAIDPKTPATLYTGTSVGVFKSTNGGDSWLAANNSLPADTVVYALVINPLTPAILYAGTGNGVFISTNGGASWDPFNSGLPTSTEIRALAIDPKAPATLYAGTRYFGVYKWKPYISVLAGFTANPTAGPFPLTVAFMNTSTGDFDTCLWDFGDGQTGSLCSPPDHVYTKPGAYTVTLTASGPGGSDTETKSNLITVEKQKIFFPVMNH